MNELDILNQVIEDLPIEYIRQIKINYDAKIIISQLLNSLNSNTKNYKLIISKLKYDNYEIQDIYYLISKISYEICNNNFNMKFYANYKKDGFNIFINDIYTIDLYKEDEELIFNFI